VTGGVFNILDRNYRTHGSGIDSPGVSAFLGLRFRF
jgi:outer membrane receptor protein involved in Fe transport